MWKPNCDSEGTIPTECTEILTNFLDEFGLRATQYLTGLYTNTLGAPPSFIQVSLQQSMVLDPLQQRWYTKNSLPLKPNKEAKCCTNPSTYFHPETSWWMSFGILRNIYWFKKKQKQKTLALILLLGNAINIWPLTFLELHIENWNLLKHQMFHEFLPYIISVWRSPLISSFMFTLDDLVSFTCHGREAQSQTCIYK